MKKYVCFGAYEPKSIRTRIYVAIKHSFASFDSFCLVLGVGSFTTDVLRI